MPFFDFALTITVIGWVLALAPVLAIIGVAIYIIVGIAQNEEEIKGLVMLGQVSFVLGLFILALTYFTPIFKH